MPMLFLNERKEISSILIPLLHTPVTDYVAALSLPLQGFHLLAFASFAGRTHQYHTLHFCTLISYNLMFQPHNNKSNTNKNQKKVLSKYAKENGMQLLFFSYFIELILSLFSTCSDFLRFFHALFNFLFFRSRLIHFYCSGTDQGNLCAYRTD